LLSNNAPSWHLYMKCGCHVWVCVESIRKDIQSTLESVTSHNLQALSDPRLCEYLMLIPVLMHTHFKAMKYGSNLLHQYFGKQRNLQMVSWLYNGTEMLRSHEPAVLSKWRLVPNWTSLQVEDKHARSSKDQGGWNWIWDFDFISVLYSHLAKPS
jgi:hypothetical protein